LKSFSGADNPGEQYAGAYLVSNRSLVTNFIGRKLPTPDPETLLAGIVVPTSRGVEHLNRACYVAASMGSPLVVLCSGCTGASAVVEAIEDRRLCAPEAGVVAVDVGEYAPPWWDLETWKHPISLDRDNEVSTKRNIGLLMAHMLEWSNLLFLDDDVHPPSPEELRSAVTLLHGTHEEGVPQVAVGWAFDDFRDDSTVGHASYLTGSRHETFIGGGALLVRIGPALGFFPNVYNEDWLFVHDLIAAGHPVALAGLARQDPYDPFASPARAEAQEFGDVLAEGVYDLLHASLSRNSQSIIGKWGTDQWPALDDGYWIGELKRRQNLLTGIQGDLDSVQIENAVSARECLKAAQECHFPSWSGDLARFASAWRDDLAGWREFRDGMQQTTGWEDALKCLGLRTWTAWGPHDGAPPTPRPEGWCHLTATPAAPPPTAAVAGSLAASPR
jgi:hypothetical protein